MEIINGDYRASLRTNLQNAAAPTKHQCELFSVNGTHQTNISYNPGQTQAKHMQVYERIEHRDYEGRVSRLY